MRKQGCFSSRIIGASGDILSEIQAYSPIEAAWVMDYKFNHDYVVHNGWKKWSSKEDLEYSEGGTGTPFSLFVECPESICEVAEAKASTVIASGLLALAFSFSW